MSEFDPNPHFKKLNDQIKSDSFEDAINTCDEILKRAKDNEVLTTKILCLLELSKYEDLITFLKSNEKYASKYAFEYSYSLFGNKKYQEALDFLNSQFPDLEKFDVSSESGKPKKISPKIKRLLLLKSQVYFCLGTYSKCVEIYEHLIFNRKQQRSKNELFPNYIATLVLSKNPQKAVSKEIIKMISGIIDDDEEEEEEEEDDHERESKFALFYNISRAYAETFRISKALKLLKKSSKKSQEGKRTDHYLVLEGYISQLSGDEERASELYQKVISQKSIEAANPTLAVAGNNLVSIYRSNQSVFEINRRLKFAFSEKVAGKLTLWQERGVYLNKLLWTLQMKNFDDCEKMFKDLEEKFPGTDIPTLIHASIFYKKKDYDRAIEILQNYVKKMKSKNPELCSRVEISLAQIHSNRGMAREAIDVLMSSTVCYYPSIVGCVIGMLRKLYLGGQKEGEVKEEGNFVGRSLDIFSKAVNHWSEEYKNLKDSKSGDKNLEKLEGVLVTLLNANAEFLFSLGKFEEAVQTYEEIIKMNPKDGNRFKACLINVLVDFIGRGDASKNEILIKKISELAKDLPAVQIPKKWNLAFLEKLNVRTLKMKKGKRAEDEEKGKQKGAGQIVGGKKKKRKRKNKKPKNFDPNKTPDPERWLPKWERSGYNKMKKRWQGAKVDGGLDSSQKKKKTKRELTQEEEIAKKMKGKGVGKKGRGRGKRKGKRK